MSDFSELGRASAFEWTKGVLISFAKAALDRPFSNYNGFFIALGSKMEL